MSDKWTRRFDNTMAVVCGCLLLIILFGVMAGCERGTEHKMTAQEMRAAIDECSELGLRSVLITDPWKGQQKIECRP